MIGWVGWVRRFGMKKSLSRDNGIWWENMDEWEGKG